MLHPNWIPVAERLPEDGQIVLVCGPTGYMVPMDIFVERALLDRKHRPWRQGEMPRWLGMDGDAIADRWPSGVTMWTDHVLYIPSDARRLPTRTRYLGEMG